jgi:hypothetical protein
MIMVFNAAAVKVNRSIAVEDAGGIGLLIIVYHASKILIVLFA